MNTTLNRIPWDFASAFQSYPMEVNQLQPTPSATLAASPKDFSCLAGFAESGRVAAGAAAPIVP